MTYSVEDFAGIAERLKEIKKEESDKPKVEVEDGKAADWANIYGAGWPSNVAPDLTAVRQNIWGISYIDHGRHRYPSGWYPVSAVHQGSGKGLTLRD